MEPLEKVIYLAKSGSLAQCWSKLPIMLKEILLQRFSGSILLSLKNLIFFPKITPYKLQQWSKPQGNLPYPLSTSLEDWKSNIDNKEQSFDHFLHSLTFVALLVDHCFSFQELCTNSLTVTANWKILSKSPLAWGSVFLPLFCNFISSMKVRFLTKYTYIHACYAY